MRISNPSAETFFTYQNAITHYEFHKEILKTQLSQQSEEQSIENLRSQLVKTMRAGKLLLINVGAASPNLLVNTTDNWPASDVWNY